MKKLSIIFIAVFVAVILSSCSGTSVSNEKYSEISDYISENAVSYSLEKDIEFFEYKSVGLSTAGVEYGYYYTAGNEIVIPDIYYGNDLSEEYEDDGGTYFGKPNNGTDWCFVKKIKDNWYYYELHWS